MKYLYGSWAPEDEETFRWASRKSPKGNGFNLQTSPRCLRFLQLAPAGHIYGQKDLKQAEARCVAYFANAKRLLQIFNNPNANLYIEQARLAGHEITKDMPEYILWKINMHACHYDEGPFKMAWDNGISVESARGFQEGYHKVNPEIRQWHESTVEEVKSKGYLEIPLFNRRRVFHEALAFYSLYKTITTQHRKDAIAWRPQTLVPQIVTTALRTARPLLPDDVWFHHHGHDSLIWSCPTDMFVEAERVIDKVMHFEIPINMMIMVIPRETTIGYSVGDMMDYHDGCVPTMAEWLEWRKPRDIRRNELIMEGIYGAHIKS